jgi:hypothetical protein
MMHVGWSLIDSANIEVAAYGCTLGQCDGVPETVILPNGNRVHGAKPGQIEDWRLVPRYMGRGEAGSAFDGTSMVITVLATDQDVINERTRRMALGFSHDFQDDRGVHVIGTTISDMVGWDDVDKSVNAMMALGLSGQSFQIVTNTGPVMITPIDWAKITMTATAFRTPLWLRSFALQAMSPIPADYANDSYWS